MSTLNIRDFDVAGWQDESRVDRLCVEVLKRFHRHLLEVEQCEPLEAGGLARGADYFLREFVIGDRQENIFEIAPPRVGQFAGNWYIIKNMEPNMEELTDLLFGVEAFYAWSADNGLVSAATAAAIREQCRNHELYRHRIESFWAISDNYLEWDREIPYKD